MHSHEPDLVAALAEGTLDSETAHAAEAEISACMRCSADLEAQQTALRAIADIAPARLFPVEAEGLRAAVAEAVNISAVAAPETPAARRVSWGALGIAAAALIGIVAVVPVLGLLQTGGDDAGSVALQIEQDEDGRSIPTSTDLAEPEAPAFAADDGAETTMVATTTEAAAAAESLETAEIAGALAPIAGEAGLDEILSSNHLKGYLLEGQASPDLELRCADAAIAQLGPNAVPLAVPLLVDGSDLVVFADPDLATVAAFDSIDCSLRLTRP